jgi:hypothetical protein
MNAPVGKNQIDEGSFSDEDIFGFNEFEFREERNLNRGLVFWLLFDDEKGAILLLTTRLFSAKVFTSLVWCTHCVDVPHSP